MASFIKSVESLLKIKIEKRDKERKYKELEKRQKVIDAKIKKISKSQ